MTGIPVRYKTHATTVCRLGYSPPIPLVPGQKFPEAKTISSVTGKSWSHAGVDASFEEVKKMTVSCSREAGIGLVMDGRSVFLDKDITPPTSASAREILRITNVSNAIDQLIFNSLGTTLTRHSAGSKRLYIYRLQQADTVETNTGPGFEIFSKRKSKQVAIYGRHPSGNEYRWENNKGPANIGYSQIPVADPDVIEKVRHEVVSILRNEGLLTVAAPDLLCTTRKNMPYTGNSVSMLMRELLQRFGREQHRRQDEIAAEFLSRAIPGTRSNALAAAVSALIVTGFDDATIIARLEPIYRTVMAATGERATPIARRVQGIRQRMSAIGGAEIRPIAELEAALCLPVWSIFR
jgi:hypothetical protein